MKHLNIKFLFALLISMLGIKASAHDIAVANADGVTIYYLYINNNTELAVSYRGASGSNYSNEYAGNVVIPESVTYNGTTYPVTNINGYAFRDCPSLTSVTIPNSVTSISDNAFYNCSGLTSVTINCKEIGTCFSGKGTLKKVIIGDEVETVVSNAFNNCSSLTEVHIYDLAAWCNITFNNSYSNPLYYAKHLYLNDEEITELVIPNSVTSIGNYSFYGCSGLTSIIIPNSVTNIGNYAFFDCI